MSYECEDCGERFDTLTAKRTHDCSGRSDAPSVDPSDATGTDQLASLCDRVEADEFDVLPEAIATFERVLTSLEGEDAEAYREAYWEYYEPLADGLDRYVREAGWDALLEFVDAYHPESGAELPHVSAVVENAVGRSLIRTRLAADVEAIPTEALAYLRSIPVAAPEGADTAFEEAQTYGWGIGHPSNETADRVHEMATDQRFWAKGVLEQAFYADQHEAAALLEALVTDEAIQFSIQHPTETVDSNRFFLDSAAGAASDFDPRIPRYWDWESTHVEAFEVEPEVRDRVRDLARRTGVADDLPDEWTLDDLQF